MLQLLFSLVFAEMALIVVFVFKTPLRKLVILSLDRAKRGRSPIVVKTLAGTAFIVMMSTLYSVVAVQRRWIEEGEVNPTDQVILAKNLLSWNINGTGTTASATLNRGSWSQYNLKFCLHTWSMERFSLFLGLMIDRLHHYIRELRIRRKNMEAAKKQSRGFEDGKPVVSEEIRTLEVGMTTSKERIEQLEIQLEEKAKEVSSAEVNALALKKQSEGFLLEYDRLLEENQNLRSQLQSIDRSLSHSDSKKFA